MKALKNETKIPTQIARDSGIRPNHISKVLRELKDTGVAECINEILKRVDYTDSQVLMMR